MNPTSNANPSDDTSGVPIPDPMTPVSGPDPTSIPEAPTPTPSTPDLATLNLASPASADSTSIPSADPITSTAQDAVEPVSPTPADTTPEFTNIAEPTEPQTPPVESPTPLDQPLSTTPTEPTTTAGNNSEYQDLPPINITPAPASPGTEPFISTDTPIIDPLAPTQEVASPTDSITPANPADTATPINPIDSLPTNPLTTPPTSAAPIPSTPANPAQPTLDGANPFAIPQSPVSIETQPQPTAPQSPTPVDTPSQPVNPMLGSIGSNQSYTDGQTTQVAGPAMPTSPLPNQPVAGQPTTPTKKPKLNRTTILIIILAAVVLIGGIVLAIVLIATNSSASSDTVTFGSSSYITSNSSNEDQSVAANLTCSATSSDEDLLESLNRPNSYQVKVDMFFIDNSLSTLTQTYTAQYDDAEIANQNLELLKNQYDTYIQDGLGLSSDPMQSEYSVLETSAISQHRVREENLTLNAARVLGFNVDNITKVSDLDLSLQSLKQAYTDQSFTCEETTSNPTEETPTE